jgi:hypothetical protein
VPGSSKWSPSLRFPHKNPVCTFTLPHTCYMPRSSRSSEFDHPNNIWWAVEIIKLIIMYFLQFPLSSSLLGPYILLSTIFLNTLKLRSKISNTQH